MRRKQAVSGFVWTSSATWPRSTRDRHIGCTTVRHLTQCANMQESPVMTLRVIGAGWGRTGTLSTKFALELLGFGPRYHMIEVFGTHPEHRSLWRSE